MKGLNRMKPVYQAKWFDKSSAVLTVFFAAAVSAPISVQAAPEGYTPVRGDTSLAGNTLTVREDRSIVEWSGGFNIAAGEAFNINHDGGQSSWVILNRDTSGLASQLDGQLNANMHVYLLNSSGVVLGSGAQLNVPSAV
ncbi:filamentous hemagglutinin N-terminal domain-containing protein, partial [bacterium]|nr:filamentous hemagglutinin N-terminal domain-containing protein [bacterium]